MANVALILNERDMNIVHKEKKLTRYMGHRRSGNSKNK